MIDDLTLDSKTLLCQGVTAAAKGDVDKGLGLLTEASVRDKDDHRPHFMSGRILAHRGRYEEALTAFKQAAERLPGIDIPTERLGQKILDKKGPEQAIGFLNQAKERGLCQYGCLGFLAQLHRQTGNDKEAEAIYTHMIKANPGASAGYMGLAGMRNQAGMHDQETKLIEQAIETENFAKLKEGQRAEIFYSLAFSRYNAGETKGAADAIGRAIKLRGDQAAWHVLAGWIEMQRENPIDGLALFQKAASLDSGVTAAMGGQGDALSALGKYEQARTAYEKAHDLAPTDTVITLKLAHMVAVLGDMLVARQLLDEVIALDKDHLPADLVKKVTALLEINEAAQVVKDQ
jgi:tetratricopeptide (TPR) repeat protein